MHRDSGGGDVAESFILSLCEEYERLEPLLELEVEMDLSEDEERAHTSATTCYLCLEPLHDETRARDHCHYT